MSVCIFGKNRAGLVTRKQIMAYRFVLLNVCGLVVPNVGKTMFDLIQ